MKLPIKGLFAHHMSFADALTPTLESLRRWLREAKALGYKGLVIVAALFDNAHMPAKKVARVFQEEGMQGIVCGFNPGTGYDPLTQPSSAMFELKRQAGYTVALADVNCGSRLMIGPVHTHHMHMRPNWGTAEKTALLKWIDMVNVQIAEELNITVAFEPLNPKEDGTRDPFTLIPDLIKDKLRLKIHWDSGHAHERGQKAEDMKNLAKKVAYLELVPQQRLVCGDRKGLVNFVEYRGVMGTLPEDVECGVEPFDPGVVGPLKLEALCQTEIPGVDNLKRSLRYLKEIGFAAAA